MSFLTILMFWSPLVAECLLHIVFAFIPGVLSALNLTGFYMKFILTPHMVAVVSYLILVVEGFVGFFTSLLEAFMVCVFKIDFAHEHEIQISSIHEGRAEIISFNIFIENDIPFTRDYEFNDVCLGSAPALHSYVLSEDLSPAWSGEHEVTASPSNEDQDRDAEIEKRNTISSCKRDGGRNDARGPEDMGSEEECKHIEGSVGEKQVRSLSRLGSRQSEKKGKDICEASTKQDERA